MPTSLLASLIAPRASLPVSPSSWIQPAARPGWGWDGKASSRTVFHRGGAKAWNTLAQPWGHLKRLGRLGRVREQICTVCLAVLEAFVTARTVSGLIQHVKSESVGGCGFEPSDTLDWMCAASPLTRIR